MYVMIVLQTRAGREQYDVWATLNNDSQWGWDGLLSYFKKSEHFYPPNEEQKTVGGARFDASVHGFNGRIKVGFPNFFFPQNTLWRKAAEALGFASSPDLCNGNPNAVGVIPTSTDPFNITR